MPELIATSPKLGHKLQFQIEAGVTIRVGRSPRDGWKIPWDPEISREHADLLLSQGRLHVKCLGTAVNPVIYKQRPTESFSIGPGDSFQIGQTTFEFSLPHVAASETAKPIQERMYGQEELSGFAFGNADQRLEILTQLPGLIATSRTDSDLAAHLVELLLEAIPASDAAAVIVYDDIERIYSSTPTMMRSKTRSQNPGPFRPSRRLIKSVLEHGESVLHVWSDLDTHEKYTVSGDMDWAFCAPIKAKSCRGWCMYLSGNAAPTTNSSGDLRFTELLAQFIGAIREVRVLEHTQAKIGNFFSPAVMENLTDVNADDLLKPRECDITVLFCDLRGFSWRAEKYQHNLSELLDRVSDALSVMTRAIIKHEGVIADFQGDAALAFWGWPTTLEEGPLPACRAALAMQQEFVRAVEEDDESLAGFEVGIGIGYGTAIAGMIGSKEQVKVGVFGPVVNLASRLESMTKQFRVPILMDEATAGFVRQTMPSTEGRCRSVGCVRPEGMKTSLMVNELLPPQNVSGAITDDELSEHETAVHLVSQGRWSEAMEIFERQSVKDRAKELLMTFIALNNYTPPSDWNGVFSLQVK